MTVKPYEVTDKCRCNNCYTIFDSDDELETLDIDGEFVSCCPECKTDEYLMQPFMQD